MSDRFVQVSNFKWGLDTRRPQLLEFPGALVQCENGFINAGGSVEQRKSFARDNTLFPNNTFGLEASSTGLVTFGSRPLVMSLYQGSVFSNSVSLYATINAQLSPGELVTLTNMSAPFDFLEGQTVIVTSTSGTRFSFNFLHGDIIPPVAITGTATFNMQLPVGDSYMALLHPLASNPSIYNPNHYDISMTMTGVVSCNYNGNVFAVAQFALGDVFFYYNGTLIPDSKTGKVVTYDDPNSLAQQVALSLNAITGWSATVTAVSANESYVTVTTPSGVTYISVVSNTWDGTITDTVSYSENTPSQAYQAAVASFGISTNGNAGDTVTVSAFSDAAGTVPVLLCSNVPCGSSTGATADNVALAINANSSITGYSATSVVASGHGNVFITAPASFGAVTFNITVTGTGTLAFVASAGAPSLTATVPGSVQGIIPFGGPGTKTVVSAQVTAKVSGGTAPYTYAWAEAATGSGGGIVIKQPTKQTTTFQKALDQATSASGSF